MPDHQLRPEDAPERSPLQAPDGLDLPVPEHTALELEDVADAAGPSALDAPEPSSVMERIQGSPTGFVMLDTEEVEDRARLLQDAPTDEWDDAPSRGEEALRAWRTRSRIAPQPEPKLSGVGKLASLMGLAMAVLLVAALVGAQAWRSHVQATAEAPAPAPAPVLVEADLPELAVPETIALTAPAVATPEPLPVELVDTTILQTWNRDGHTYWQFDVTSREAPSLRWRDASGVVRLDDTTCQGRVSAEVGRCYVARTHARLQWELKHGATAGLWSLEACTSDGCQVVDRFHVE